MGNKDLFIPMVEDKVKQLMHFTHRTRASTNPSHEHLLAVLLLLTLASFILMNFVQSLSPRNLRRYMLQLGIHFRRISRTMLEIERKTFHLSGLIVPLTYQYALNNNISVDEFVRFSWTCTAIAWSADIARIFLGTSVFPFSLLKNILREKEKAQLCGTSYFSLGCTVAISLFPPHVAICSMLWLIIGDLSAALVGVSFGGDIAVVKLGRDGKKSMEGSLAMFIICFLVGQLVFGGKVYLSEYAVTLGAATATIVEMYEPWGMNDNLTIPVLSCFALQYGLSRVEMCAPS